MHGAARKAQTAVHPDAAHPAARTHPGQPGGSGHTRRRSFRRAAPCGRRTARLRHRLSHVPAMRGIFQPRQPCRLRLLPCRCDRATNTAAAKCPCGVRSIINALLAEINYISIHAPLAGCDDRGPFPGRARPPISIHAPLAGCDQNLRGQICRAHISIHAPLAGCDAKTRRLVLLLARFQSTHPLRGATGRGC